MNTKKFKEIIIVLVLGVLSSFLFENIYKYTSYEIFSECSGVWKHCGRWVASQGRLLAPYTILYISKLFGISGLRSMYWYCGTFIIFFPVVCWSLTNKKNALQNTLLFVIAFILISDPKFFMVWDAFDMVMMMAFCAIITRDLNRLWLVPVFAIGILNRESALFIPLYTLGEGLFRKGKRNLIIPSVVAGVAGAALVIFLRQYLYAGSDTHAGNHLNLFMHIREAGIREIIIIVSLFAWLTINNPPIYYALFFLTVLSCIIIFGYPNETRIYYNLIPLAVFANQFNVSKGDKNENVVLPRIR